MSVYIYIYICGYVVVGSEILVTCFIKHMKRIEGYPVSTSGTRKKGSGHLEFRVLRIGQCVLCSDWLNIVL